MLKTKNQDLYNKVLNRIKESKKFLMEAGFEEFVVEDFQQPLVDIIELIGKWHISVDSL
jgi:hypothetical protein